MSTTTFAPEVLTRWATDGCLVLPRLFNPSALQLALTEAEAAFLAPSARGAGVRDALRWPALRAIADADPISALARTLLDRHAFVTRAILFDKSPTANWDVPWHQETTIAVVERLDVPGFGPWSLKAGIPHVQPPAEVLGRIVTIRIHLDPCGPDNGALLVVPGSHRAGILASTNASDCDRLAICCAVEAGGVVVMRPLLLHASRKATNPSHRRVLHLDFAASPLPGNLRWARA